MYADHFGLHAPQRPSKQSACICKPLFRGLQMHAGCFLASNKATTRYVRRLYHCTRRGPDKKEAETKTYGQRVWREHADSHAQRAGHRGKGEGLCRKRQRTSRHRVSPRQSYCASGLCCRAVRMAPCPTTETWRIRMK